MFNQDECTYFHAQALFQEGFKTNRDKYKFLKLILKYQWCGMGKDFLNRYRNHNGMMDGLNFIKIKNCPLKHSMKRVKDKEWTGKKYL